MNAYFVRGLGLRGDDGLNTTTSLYSVHNWVDIFGAIDLDKILGPAGAHGVTNINTG